MTAVHEQVQDRSPAYAGIAELIRADVAVTLDGAVATEIERTQTGTGEGHTADQGLWGTWAPRLIWLRCGSPLCPCLVS